MNVSPQSQSKSPWRRLLFAGLAVSLFAVTARAQPPGPVPDPGAVGPYAVGFTSIVLEDGSRPAQGALRPDGSAYAGRPIPLLIWYPADAPSGEEARYPLDPVYGRGPPAPSSLYETYGVDGATREPPVSEDAPFPLVLFSTGSGGAAAQHVSFAARLASHGFVVAVFQHFGSGVWAWEPRYGGQLDVINRPLDLSFALTGLLSFAATPGHLLEGAIREDQVAAAGWSFGGYTAMVLAGGDDAVCDTAQVPTPAYCVPCAPDPRFRAIVTLDGSAQFLHWRELARITVPSLLMGREWSVLEALAQAGGPNASWVTTFVARPHGAMRGHPNLRVDVAGTNHQSFADVCVLNAVIRDMGLITETEYQRRYRTTCANVTPPSEVQPLLAQYAIAFLKTALVGDAGLDYYLTPGWALTREPLAELFVTEKRSPNAAEDECVAGPTPCPEPQLFLYFPHQPGSERASAEKDPAVQAGMDDGG